MQTFKVSLFFSSLNISYWSYGFQARAMDGARVVLGVAARAKRARRTYA